MGDQLLKNPKFSDFTKKTSFIHQFAKYTDFSPRKWPFSPDEKLQIKKTTFLPYKYDQQKTILHQIERKHQNYGETKIQ